MQKAALLLFALLTVPVPLCAQPTDTANCAWIDRERLGPFTVASDSFYVEVDTSIFKRSQAMSNRSAIGLQIKDAWGKTHHRISLMPLPECGRAPAGFDRWFEIDRMFVLQTSDGEALVVDYGGYPSASPGGAYRLLFAKRDGKLRPLSKSLTVYGDFGKLLPGSREGTQRLHRGDVMPFHEWTGYYSVTVPVKIRLSSSGPLRLPPFTPSGAHESGLVPLQTEFYARHYWGDNVGGPVALYPTLTSMTPSEVTVRPASRVKLGRAYAVPRLSSGARGVTHIGADVERLEVTINGKTGFVEVDDETFKTLGITRAE